MWLPAVAVPRAGRDRATGPHDPARGLYFRDTSRLIDPYAAALAGDFQTPDGGVLRPPKCVVIDEPFDWENDRRPRYEMAESQ